MVVEAYDALTVRVYYKYLPTLAQQSLMVIYVVAIGFLALIVIVIIMIIVIVIVILVVVIDDG